MRIYETIQDDLNELEWKKHAKNFMKQKLVIKTLITLLILLTSSDSNVNDELK